MEITSLDLFLLISSIILLFLYYYTLLFPKPSSSQLPLPPSPKGIPIFGNLLQLGPMPHQTLRDMSSTYGPLFHLRLGYTSAVVVSSPSVAAHFLKNDSNFCCRPPNSGAEHMAYNYHDLVFAPYGPRWRLMRKVSAVHLLGPKALDDNQRVREEELAVLVRLMYMKKGAAVNVGTEMHVCSTNALSRAMMGRRVFEKVAAGLGEGEEAEKEMRKADEFKDMVVEVMTLAGVFNIGDFVPWLKPFDLQGVVRKMKRVHRRYDVFLDGLMEECRKEMKVGGGKDLVSVLVGMKGMEDGDGGEITDVAIKAVVLVML